MPHRIGVLGGGQLGRMLLQEALNLDIELHFLDSDPSAPCANNAHSFCVGAITDYDTVLHFGRNFEVITVEIENVSVEALKQLELEGRKVYPQPRILELIRDKGNQKQFYQDNGIPTAQFAVWEEGQSIPRGFSLPFVQKLRRGGYDGKGVKVMRRDFEWDKRFTEPSIIEAMVPFVKELSVIVARNANGDVAAFDAVECKFNAEANLVEFLFSPADISKEIASKAQEIGREIISKLDMVGLLAVEFFLIDEGELLVNEIAPRPHNSGHHTIECCHTSQFEQHLRAILNLPLGDTSLIVPGAMLNVVGEKGFEGPAVYVGLEEVLKVPGVYVHLYGKTYTKPFRKMGHVTLLGKDLVDIKSKVDVVKRHLRCISTQV
jgi:5-(carboxyamino)imidazole ribonucleotide synthase